MEHEIKNVINLTWPTLVIVLSIIIILRLTYIFKSERKSMVLHEELFNLLFLAYLIVLFELVTSQDLPGGGTNFMPFREILRYDYGTRSFYKQVFGNILMFVPLGYYATSYCKIKNLGTITLVSLLASSVIETVQHFIGRTFDIDDHLPKFMQKDWIYNVISILIIALIVIYIIKVV